MFYCFTLSEVINIQINSKKYTLTYGAETWEIKWKHRHNIFATKMDYLRHAANIS
jgi:hypothetical protein